MAKSIPLYLRLPAELKAHVDRYANDSDESMTVVVARLVEVGLRNSDEAVGILHDRIACLELEIATLREEGERVRAELDAHRDDSERSRTVFDSVLHRLSLPVGKCPTCQELVSGQHVFVDGACANQHSLQTSVIAPSAKSGLNQAELLAALAVVGVALGVAVLIAKS